MDRARQAVSDFVSRDGHHKTSVDESVAPAVTNEHVKPHRHEEMTQAVDREVHQDHHHTTVQPVTHREVMPEVHEHNAMPVTHKEFHHEDKSATKQKLEQEAARFANTSTTHDSTHSSSTAPIVESERVHHHVHEHVQPVIQKETVAPSVVHTTVPVHETHHASSQHHGTSTLPVKTLDEFRTGGGILDGKGSTQHGEYDGCPRPYNKSMQEDQLEADRDMHTHSHGMHDHSHNNNNLTGREVDGVDGGYTGSGNNEYRDMNTRDNEYRDSGVGMNSGTTTSSATGAGNNDFKLGTTNTNTSTGSTKKPGLMAKLNPKVDSNGDGKAGFMK